MDYRLDYNAPVKKLDHYWELCVGSGHAALALREDYRQQLAKCARELGFKYVRFHGLFCDDMSVCLAPSRFSATGDLENGCRLSFTNIDSVFDFLLSIGMKPFVELGFMPAILTSGPTTIFHYNAHTSPPDDYGKWEWLIERFTEHCVERYGLDEVRQWFFEVWNEPNLGGREATHGFFGGNIEDYFMLYKHAAQGVKKVDAKLKVGGPATADNSWIPELIEYCRTNNVPLDFVTTHNYATDLNSGIRHGKARINFAALDEKERKKTLNIASGRRWDNIPRGLLTEWAKEARDEAQGLPLIYTEWHPSGGPASDGPFGSSFTVKTLMDNHGIVDGYSYWTFTDIFEEQGMPHVPYMGTFGMQTIQGIPKAPYRAFQLLHKLGEEIYTENYANGNVDIYAVKKAACDALQLMVVNHNSPGHPIQDEKIHLCIDHLPTLARATIERIDETHGNSVRRWHELGEPDYPDTATILDLMAASYTKAEPIEVKYAEGKAAIDLTIPEMGVALITLYL